MSVPNAIKDGNVAQELHQTRAVLVLRYLFERRLANFNFFSKLRMAVYPSNMARIGAKLRQHAFQTICKFRFFDAEEKKNRKKNRLRIGFSSFSADFGGARPVLTSKSDSSRFFASDGQIFRSV